MCKTSVLSAFLSCIGSHNSFGNGLNRCAYALTRDEEVSAAGNLYMCENSLEVLDDGFYVYLISACGKLALSERLGVGMEEGKVLVTHRSLYNKLVTQLQEEKDALKIKAAGEFRILNKRVMRLSNRSGTFPEQGTPELQFSETVLLRYGLPVESKTLRVDESQKGLAGDHLKDTEEVLARLRFNNSNYSSVYTDATSVYTELYSRYPGDNPPGVVDWQTLIKDRPDLSKNYELALFISLVQSDGIAGALHMWQGTNPDNASVLRVFERLKKAVGI